MTLHNKAEQLANEWTAKAIDKCRNDPQLAAMEEAGDLCISCMMPRPCICDKNFVICQMRAFYEANRRTLFRAEPKLIGSWGRDLDGLMTGLLKIARRPYEVEIARLRRGK